MPGAPSCTPRWPTQPGCRSPMRSATGDASPPSWRDAGHAVQPARPSPAGPGTGRDHRPPPLRRRPPPHLPAADPRGAGIAGPPAGPARRPRVLFVCTANSARSHLAAALWRQASSVPAESAGTHPAAAIRPRRSPPPTATACHCPGRRPRHISRGPARRRLHRHGLRPGPRGTRRASAVHWSVPDPVPAGDPGSFDAALAARPPRRALRAAPGGRLLTRSPACATGQGRRDSGKWDLVADRPRAPGRGPRGPRRHLKAQLISPRPRAWAGDLALLAADEKCGHLLQRPVALRRSQRGSGCLR